MQKQIIGRENAVEALAALCRDYRGTALRAVRQGGEEVYIPADPENPRDMLEALANPGRLMQFESGSNYEHKEPCYASLDEFLVGKNADGTEHRGYFAVDVVAKVVTDLKDRTGRSVVPIAEKFNPGCPFNELRSQPNQKTHCL